MSSFPPHISCPHSSHNSSQNHLPFNTAPSAPGQVRTGLGQGQDAVSQILSMRSRVQTSQLCLRTALPPLREFLCEMSLERGRSCKKRILKCALAESSPRISLSVLPVRPRILPGLPLQLPPSLEGVEGGSSWGALEGAQGLPSLHSLYCRTQKRLGQFIHSFIQSHSFVGHSTPGSRWCSRPRMMRQAWALPAQTPLNGAEERRWGRACLAWAPALGLIPGIVEKAT